MDLLIRPPKQSNGKESTKSCYASSKGCMEMITASNDVIYRVSSLCIRVPDDLRAVENRRRLYRTLMEIEKHFPNGIPLLKATTHMNITSKQFKNVVEKVEMFENRQKEHPLYNTKLSERFGIHLYVKKLEAMKELGMMKYKWKQAENSSNYFFQMEELSQRKNVLCRLKYLDDYDMIKFKGVVSCKVRTPFDLLLSELILNGSFNRLTPEYIAALLSCFVCNEKSTKSPTLATKLHKSLHVLQLSVRRIGLVSSEYKVPFDEKAYLEELQPTLMDVVYAWCQGDSFSSLSKLTDVSESSIIRSMRRLVLLLQKMCHASQVMGNIELIYKFTEAIRLLKRDIVFADSLYWKAY